MSRSRPGYIAEPHKCTQVHTQVRTQVRIHLLGETCREQYVNYLRTKM